jgi:SAM-dependent methyltransferase
MPARDAFFFLTGIGFLAASKAKFMFEGYSSPKPFNISQTERCIDYDIRVVEGWLSHLRNYTKGDGTVAGKNVLEIGPGSDLGTGLCLLSKGCAQYSACDVHNLMKTTPDRFYERFLERLKADDSQVDIEGLRKQLEEAKRGSPLRLRYAVTIDFDLVSVLGESTVDIVFSQAAFEHFEDIDALASQLAAVCKPGAVLVAEIDLQTHSRWIRDKDPNNIYRYPKYIYDAFRFRGVPNRLRPFQYSEVFSRLGWTDVSIAPLSTLNGHGVGRSGLNPAFADGRSQIDYLSILFCARRGQSAKR